ncbi:hypothetical protein IFM89_023041 [Coptis chinensis]|uniref:F-box domain-containing protein n=1 Tax=Coptis chinensis TaxID=261450 RepID=A0A835ICC0_9MAGN|nr:hypothetical protein IFM89_023041 [Coptis chinensis]
MDRISRDNAVDILSRLPIRDLLRCRGVCKSWCTIASDPTFSTTLKLKFRKTSTTDLIIWDKFDNTMFFAEDSKSDYDRRNRVIRVSNKFYFSCKEDLWDDLNVLGSCNGILCLSNFSFKRIRLYNPISEEYLLLPNFVTPGRGNKVLKILSGFGFDDVFHKVVLLLFYEIQGRCKSKIVMNEMQVYTPDSNVWQRSIGSVPNMLINAYELASSVFIDGSLHWITTADKSSESGSRLLIVSLHLGREDFGVTETPISVLVELEFTLKHYVLGVLQECLSLVNSSTGRFVDVWILKNDEGKQDWSKLFSIWTAELVLPAHLNEPVIVRPIKLQNNGVVLLVHNHGLVVYNAEANKGQFLIVDGRKDKKMYSYKAIPLLGSLISIKSPCRMDSGEKYLPAENGHRGKRTCY